MKYKTIAIILAPMLFLSAFSCQSTTPDNSEKTQPESDSTAEIASSLPERDFQNYPFTFLNGNTSYTYNNVTASEQNGETINDAIYKRNLDVEEMYNITIEEIISDNPQSDFTKSVTAQDNCFDIALLRMEWAFPAVLENQALNWNLIPHLNLDQPYWVQGSISGMSLMNNVYFAVSLFDVSHFESVRTFLFNKNMVAEYNMDSPYQLVKDGKWTLDKFYEMSLSTAQDLDNDGKWTANDQYGVIGYSNVLCNTLMTGVGSILSIGKDDNDMPYFDLDNEYNMERLLAVSKLFENKDGFVYKENDQNMFRDGKSLFLSCLFSEVIPLRDMEDDFGIIPAPKYDEQQSEYINLGGSPFFMVVPVTADNLDRTGAIMEALAMLSTDVIDTAYYDIVLKGKSSRDSESLEMLDLIFSTLEYYHPLANSYLNSPLADQYIWNGRSDFASYFASVKDQINTDIDTAMKTYSDNVK